jgi:hypothetical protein
MTRTQVAKAVLNSTEYLTDEVKAAYEEYLGRAADSTGLAHYVSLLQSGTSLQTIDVDLATSPEGIAHSGSASNSLAELYKIWIGRTSDPTGLSYFTNRAGATTTNLQQTALSIIDSSAANTAQIQNQFEKYLDRAPTSSEVSTWVANFANGMTYSDLTLSLITSLEFRNSGM